MGLQTARLFSIPRLEHQCVEFMANAIEEIVHDEKFKQLVIRDAENVKAREETDSIDIIDELRYVLRTTNWKTLDFRFDNHDFLFNRFTKVHKDIKSQKGGQF